MRKIALRKTSFRSTAVLAAIRIRDLSCAERAHASTRVLAAFQLTIDPKRNSAALGRGFWFVANPATTSGLPLQLVAGSKQKLRAAPRFAVELGGVDRVRGGAALPQLL